MSWLCPRALLVSVGLWLVALPGAALPLRIDRSAERMRVDGALREWKGARFAQLGDGSDAMLRYALASTDQGFYLAAELGDEQLVRKSEAGPGQDAVVLALALPDSSGALRSSEVWLHAGRAGQQKAAAAVRGVVSAAGIEVVEGPRERGPGYVLEAFIPFASLDGAALWEQGRATLRFEDFDQPGQKQAEAVLATATGKPADWPRIVLGTGQSDFLGAFLRDRSLSGVEPRFDQRANVAGDATPERVLIIDRYVLVYGPGFKRGETYSYFSLPYGIGGGMVSAELFDLTGDGRSELLTRVRQRNDLGARDVFVVLALEEEGIGPLFSLELKKEAKGGFIEASLSIDRKSKPPRINVSTGRAQGLDALTYQESPATDALPILLPWGAVESRSYAFDGSKFAQVAEKARSVPAAAAPAPAPQKPATLVPSPEAAPEAAPAAVPAAAPASDLAKALLPAPALGSFRFDREANLVGGAAKERSFVYERQVVVTGPDLGPAPTYVAYGLPLKRAEDLLGLELGDVTGDGRGELLVRYRMQGSATEHELLLVLRVEAQEGARRLTPLLQAELTRRRGSDAIVNEVQVKGGKLSISPGKAQGFTRENYPFPNEPQPGIERLLLPWLDKAQRYRFDGARLRAE
jgi:hypothetical protein